MSESVALVELSIRILIVLPCSDAGRTLFIQGSPPPELSLGAAASVTSEAGKGRNVLIGAGVSVGIAVGGSGVTVGMAAWVSATIVRAAAAIVLCMPIGLTVGVAATFAPHALRISAIMSIRVSLGKRFM